MKTTLTERAVRGPLLCIRPESGWLHQAIAGCNGVWQTQEDTQHHGDDMDYAIFPHPRIPDLTRGSSTHKVKNLLEMIEHMIRDEAAHTHSPEEGRAPTEDKSI